MERAGLSAGYTGSASTTVRSACTYSISWWRCAVFKHCIRDSSRAALTTTIWTGHTGDMLREGQSRETHQAGSVYMAGEGLLRVHGGGCAGEVLVQALPAEVGGAPAIAAGPLLILILALRPLLLQQNNIA